jgi:hypothetical protein
MPVPPASCHASPEGYKLYLTAFLISEYYNHVTSNLLSNPLLYLS